MRYRVNKRGHAWIGRIVEATGGGLDDRREYRLTSSPEDACLFALQELVAATPDCSDLKQREFDTIRLFSSVELTEGKKRVWDWTRRSWDRRDGEPDMPKSDWVYHGSRKDAIADADCALDALLEGAAQAKKRVVILRAARAGGYTRMWGRGAG